MQVVDLIRVRCSRRNVADLLVQTHEIFIYGMLLFPTQIPSSHEGLDQITPRGFGTCPLLDVAFAMARQ